MQTENYLYEIQRQFPPESVKTLVYSLFHDPLVWQEITEKTLWEKIEFQAWLRLFDWNPGNFAFLLLDLETNTEDLAKTPLVALPKMIQQKSVEAFENTMQNQQPPTTLAEAGLLALALRERRRIVRTWDGLVEELSTGKEPLQYTIWRTPFACLYRMVPDGLELLQALVQGGSWDPYYAIVSHVLCANPFVDSERVDEFVKVIDQAPITHQVEWLRQLRLRGEQNLAQMIAAKLLEANKDLYAEIGRKPAVRLDERGKQLLKIESLVDLFHFSGQIDEWNQAIKRLRQQIETFETSLTVKTIEAASQQGDIGSARTEASLISKKYWPEALRPEIAYIQSRLFDNPDAILANLSDHHDFLSVIGKIDILTRTGLREEAQNLIKVAYQKILDYLEKNPVEIPIQMLSDWKPSGLIETMIVLGLHEEALRIGERILRLRPCDVDLLGSLARIHEKAGNFDEAINYARLGLVLEPENPETHRKMAYLWEQKDEWVSAFDEWNRVVQLNPKPLISDWLNHGRAAAKSNQPHHVIESCGRVLDENPDHLEASLLLARAYLDTNHPEEAIRRLDVPAVLTSSQPEGWLLLSEAHGKMGNIEKKIDTLRIAVSTLPESAVLHHSMAKSLVHEGRVEDSLPYLQRARELEPESQEVCLDLAHSLRKAEKNKEACEILKEAVQKYPDEAEIAYQYAETLVELGKTEDAIEVFEKVIQNRTTNFERLMLYVNILLGNRQVVFEDIDLDVEQRSKAVKAINRAIEINPENHFALMLKAELLAASGMDSQALEIYQSLHEIEEFNTQETVERFNRGLGLLALRNGQFTVAIKALKKALDEHPSDIRLMHLLAEAYFSNNMIAEAMRIAGNALEVQPDHLENISWFVDKAVLMEEYPAAVAALQRATELTPENPGIWIKLAEFRNEIGQKAGAKEALDRFLMIDETTVDDLRHAARLYFILDEEVSALSCLEHALQLGGELPASLFFEIACANVISGNFEIALDILHQASGLFPEDGSFFVFESDIYYHLSRPQMALTSVEQAVGLLERGIVEWFAPKKALAIPPELPEKWLSSLIHIPKIFLRHGFLLRAAGDLLDAKKAILKALEFCPTQIAIRFVAADLSYSMLLFKEAEELSDYSLLIPSYNSEQIIEETSAPLYQECLINLNCLLAEIALSRQEDDLAGSIIRNFSGDALSSRRIRALQARLFMRNGQRKEALELYQQVIKDPGNKKANYQALKLNWPFTDPLEFCGISQDNWLVEAALEMQCWEDAIQFCGTLTTERPHEAINHFQLAKILTLCAEERRILEELNCVNNLPAEDTLAEEKLAMLKQAINNGKGLSNSEEFERWLARGVMAFRPTQQNIQFFSRYASTPAEIAVWAMALRQTNRKSEAIATTSRAPAVPDILVQLALALAGEDTPKGVTAAKKAVELSPANPVTQIVLSILAESNYEYETAYRSLEAALSIWDDEPHWHIRAARIAEEMNIRDGRLTHWEKAYELDPNQPETIKGVGEAYLLAGKYLEAVERLRKAYEIDPANEQVLYMLSKAYMQQGRLHEALESSELAMKANPNNPGSAMLAGEIAMGLNKLEKAFEYARKAVELDPKNPRELLLLADVLVKQGKPEDALTVLDHTVNMIGPDVSVHLYRARLIHQVKGPQVALPFLEDLARLDPENTEVLGFLAKTQISCGEEVNAEETLYHALRITPSNPELNLVMGRLQKTQGQLDKAVHYLSEATKYSTREVEPFLELANSYKERKEYLQALNYYQQAIRIAPKDDRAYYQAALVMREVKDYQGAETMLRKAAQLSPDDLSIRRQLSAVIALNLVHNTREVNPIS